MGGKGPQLFADKPKKSMLKASVAPPLPPPPLPPQPKGFFRSRYWVLVPLLLTVNFSIGAYVLVNTTIRDKRISEEIPEELTSSTSSSTA